MPLKKVPKNRLNNLKQAEVELGIPFASLKAMKVLFPDCFTSNGTLIRDNIVQHWKDDRAVIEKASVDSIGDLKAIKLKNDIVLQEIEIEEAKKQVVSIEEVKEFLQCFGVQLTAVLKAKLVKELPPIITGLKEEDVIQHCKTFYNELVELLNTNMDNWNGKGSKE